ncbi:MAG: helix-turn-helix domain-containing protein [Pseudomonadota bacterium]
MNDRFSQYSTGTPTAPTGRSRRRDPRKLIAIAAAARAVMTARGIRLTQVSDVARAAGVGAGTIYLYAADKEALVGLALRSAAEFPLREDTEVVGVDSAELTRLVGEVVESCFVWPALRAAATTEPTPATVAVVFAEAYDLVVAQRRLIAFLDRCSSEVPAFAEAWHERTRRVYFRELEVCLARHAAHGVIRNDVDFGVASRALLEMIVWMAQRRVGDPVTPACGDDTARRTTLTLVMDALRPRPSSAARDGART